MVLPLSSPRSKVSTALRALSARANVIYAVEAFSSHFKILPASASKASLMSSWSKSREMLVTLIRFDRPPAGSSWLALFLDGAAGGVAAAAPDVRRRRSVALPRSVSRCTRSTRSTALSRMRSLRCLRTSCSLLSLSSQSLFRSLVEPVHLVERSTRSIALVARASRRGGGDGSCSTRLHSPPPAMSAHDPAPLPRLRRPQSLPPALPDPRFQPSSLPHDVLESLALDAPQEEVQPAAPSSSSSAARQSSCWFQGGVHAAPPAPLPAEPLPEFQSPPFSPPLLPLPLDPLDPLEPFDQSPLLFSQPAGSRLLGGAQELALLGPQEPPPEFDQESLLFPFDFPLPFPLLPFSLPSLHSASTTSSKLMSNFPEGPEVSPSALLRGPLLFHEVDHEALLVPLRLPFPPFKPLPRPFRRAPSAPAITSSRVISSAASMAMAPQALACKAGSKGWPRRLPP
mmetsp:Transcript_57678/g.124718  ORF Transcript_57678/g.124718 Transcript_57678/m.124718 type:complete len:456 (+) Transcript_57678:85-1452(+)